MEKFTLKCENLHFFKFCKYRGMVFVHTTSHRQSRIKIRIWRKSSGSGFAEKGLDPQPCLWQQFNVSKIVRKMKSEENVPQFSGQKGKLLVCTVTDGIRTSGIASRMLPHLLDALLWLTLHYSVHENLNKIEAECWGLQQHPFTI